MSTDTQIDELRGGLLAAVGHEMRTPLTCIHGTLELLANNALGPLSDAANRMVARGVSNSTRLIRLVNRMLDVNRLKAGRMVLNKSQCRLIDLMQHAIRRVEARAIQRQVRLETEVDEGHVWADADRIIEVLENLLDNAIRHSLPDGQIRLEIHRQEGFVQFSVEDHGIGIAPEHWETVFEDFGQLDQSNTRQQGGVGLGLPLSRYLVRQHGGRMWVESRPTHGSVFFFLLPAPAAQSLLDNTDSIKALVDNISDVFWVKDCASNRIVYVSPSYERLWGRSCESLYTDASSWLENIHEEDRSRVRQAAEEQLTTPYRVEYRVLTPGGDKVRWIGDRSYPVRNAFGETIALVGIAEDITATHLAEAELRTLNLELEVRVRERTASLEVSHLQYQSLVDSATDAVLAVSQDGTVLEWNRGAARMFGYTREDMVGSSVVRVLPTGLHPATTAETGPRAVAGRRRDGSEVPVELCLGSWDVAGLVTYSCIIRDMTTRRVLEGQLRQAQKMEAIGQLAGGVAHDFNNLLTVITGYTGMLLTDMDLQDPRRSLLSDIGNAADRAAGLTSQLLTFSRRHVVKPENVDVNTVVDASAKMLRRLIGEDIDFTVEKSAEPVTVSGDRGQLEQILMNLAVNARDAMPEGGNLHLRTARVTLQSDTPTTPNLLPPGPYLELTLSDTGIGMDEETLGHLFEPFFTTKPVGQGTGLGLATVYGIVAQSQGGIRVNSVARQGTTFTIYLPLAPDTASPARPASAETIAPGRGETVLVVEDDTPVRGFIVKALRINGYHVLEAANGEAGLAAALHTQRPIDLLVTDIVMPGLSGTCLAERLRQERPEARILLLSGYLDDKVARYNVQRQDIDFLRKPLRLSTLLSTVRDILDRPHAA